MTVDFRFVSSGYQEPEGLAKELEVCRSELLRRQALESNLQKELQALRAENKRLREALMGISAVAEMDEYQLSKAAVDEFSDYKIANSLVKAATNGELCLGGILQTCSYIRGACEQALQQQAGGERE